MDKCYSRPHLKDMSPVCNAMAVRVWGYYPVMGDRMYRPNVCVFTTCFPRNGWVLWHGYPTYILPLWHIYQI